LNTGRSLVGQHSGERAAPAVQHGLSVRDEHPRDGQVEQRRERLAEVVVRRFSTQPALGTEPQRIVRGARLGTCSEQDVADDDRLLPGEPVDDLVLAGGLKRP
jgi:hypothetical protein